MATNLISRTDAQALMPEEVVTDLLKDLVNDSAALTLFRQIPVGRAQVRMPIISALPMAYFINGDTGMIPFTEVDWTNRFLNIEKIATMVVIPGDVFEDSGVDLWGMIKPLVQQAIGRAIDGAIFFGTNKPATWPADIATAAAAAGNVHARGVATIAQGGIAEDINQTFGLVEGDGFDVSGVVTRLGMKAILRGARATTGEALLNISQDELMGQRIGYAMNGLWPNISGAAELFAGDFNQGIMGIRQEIEYTMLSEATLNDPISGAPAYNLAQQDAVAMRVILRVGFQVANTINYQQSDESARYPFAVMTKP